MPYDTAIDMWAAGCTLYEMYTGQVCYFGKNNNEMLRKFQEVNGAFPVRSIKRHRASYDKLMLEPQFEEDGRFRSHEPDIVTGKDVLKMLLFTKPKKGNDLGSLLLNAKDTGASKRQVRDLQALLQDIFCLDPAHRMSCSDALKHTFVTSKN